MFDLQREKDDLRESYGDEFGQRCLLARRLIQRGVRFVEVAHNMNFVNGTGWDTHNQNFDAMKTKCPPLDQALAALLADLEARGLLEETLVVLATELGRTPKIVTERMGRNHYPKAFTCLLAGGGVGDGDERRAGLAPPVHARAPRSGKAAGGDGYGRNAGLLDGDHVVGKPRRATPSMGRRPDHGVDLGGDPGGFLVVDVIPAA